MSVRRVPGWWIAVVAGLPSGGTAATLGEAIVRRIAATGALAAALGPRVYEAEAPKPTADNPDPTAPPYLVIDEVGERELGRLAGRRPVLRERTLQLTVVAASPAAADAFRPLLRAAFRPGASPLRLAAGSVLQARIADAYRLPAGTDQRSRRLHQLVAELAVTLTEPD